MESTPSQMKRTNQQAVDLQRGGNAQATTRLAATGYPALQNVYCESSEDMLILYGVVLSYYMKQLAQIVAGKMDGIKRIENRLEVRSVR